MLDVRCWMFDVRIHSRGSCHSMQKVVILSVPEILNGDLIFSSQFLFAGHNEATLRAHLRPDPMKPRNAQ